MSMALKLYEIGDDYLRALERLPESGLDEQTIADTMEGLEGALTIKAQAVCAYVLNLEAEADAVEIAAKRMAERARILHARMDSLRGYLHENMLRTGITEIKANDGTFRARIRNNPPAVEVIDEKFIPEQFMRVIPERMEPDKTMIKEAIKAGDTVPGVMVRQTTRLELKT